MKSISKRLSALLGLAALFTLAALAETIPVGFVSWDISFPGNAGQFDITNLTGPNAAPPTFPITTTVNPSSLNLVVDFSNGSSSTFGPGSGYFSLSPDLESFDGSPIVIGGTNPLPTMATLTGVFSPLTIAAPGSVTIKPDFSVTILPDPGSATLVDGDFGVIYATTASPSVPEPGIATLLMGFVGLMTTLIILASPRFRSMVKATGPALLRAFLPVLCLVVVSASAFGQVKLTAWTSPSSGVASQNYVNITGSSFPSGTITPANVVVSIYTKCGGAAVTTTTANSVISILGSTKRVQFLIPATLTTTGDYFLTIADSAPGDANFTTIAGSCEEVSVTVTSHALTCLAGSSLGVVLLPKSGATGNVTAYVPKGYWDGGSTGLFVENIEGILGPAVSIATPNVTNSCSSNSATGQTVCVANNTDVYLITGTTLNSTLTSGSNAYASFSGGYCENCGVAVNPYNNTAVINMGISGSPSGSGVQILDLKTNTFGPLFPMNEEVSENISIDVTRSLILTAGEDGNATLLQIQSNGSLKEFDSSFATGGTNDSNAEDCSTGIQVSPQEFSNNVTLVNLSDITFGTTTYTAPNANVTLTTAYSFSAGLSGSAVAQGSGHLAVVTGEFGGNTFAVLKLPPTPSTAVPSLVDYVVYAIPASAACGGTFGAGFDPHTVTAYTSPNTGDSYAVFAGYSSGTAGIGVPICLAVVDMTTLINLPLSDRGYGGYGANDIPPTNAAAAAAVTFFAL